MIKRLAHVALKTSDLDRLVDYYCENLDCEVVHEFKNGQDERYGVFLAIGKSQSFIEIFNQDNPKQIAGDGSIKHFCFEVENISERAERFIELGHTVAIERGRTDHILQFTVLDPDGNEIEFHQYDEDCVFWPHIQKTGNLS